MICYCYITLEVLLLSLVVCIILCPIFQPLLHKGPPILRPNHHLLGKAARPIG